MYIRYFQEQLHQAYPQFNHFISWKKTIDPQEIFVNHLYMKYAH